MPRKQYLSNETYHQSKSGNLVSEKVIRIGVSKAVVIFATAVIGSAGSAFWAGLRIANAIPFQIQAIEKEVAEMKGDHAKLMPLDLSLEKWRNQERVNAEITKKLDILDDKVTDILKTLQHQ